MDHTIEKGIYGEGEVWRFYTVEEAEQHKSTSSWQYVIEQMKKYLGKTWVSNKEVMYYFNNEPRYMEYKIIGVEDNEPYADYYWILQHGHITKYELINSADFYNNIKE